MAIKLETPVRQILPAPIDGVVKARRFKEDADQMEYLQALYFMIYSRRLAFKIS